VSSAIHAQQPTAEEVVARYIAARGGLDRIESIHTIIYRGEYGEAGGAMDHAAMALMRPYYKLVGDPERPSPDFAEGYDGSAWEFYGDPGVVLRTVGAASAAGRHATNIGGPLVGYAARGWTIALKGIDTVGERPAYRILIQMPDGFEQEELIDTVTSLLIAERKTAPVHAFGSAVSSEERFGDYRLVHGVLFPFSHREVDIASGRVLNQMRWTSITVNRVLEAAAFVPPSFARTPLQALLEHLYAERTDMAAVQWSYSEFRQAHAGLDTHAGVEFIGYQMLKMGDTTAAVRLLTINAADYPASATAAFGLGRAYWSTGDTAQARAQFRRALAIDATYTAARRALETP